MKVVLVNPPWSFGSSMSFGCREPHCQLGLGHAKGLLEVDGHLREIATGAIQAGCHLASNALEAACRHR